MSSEFFCSHSVAHVLKAMNVLPSAVPSTEYLPYSFSSEVELPLLRGASFSKELFIRGNKSSVFDSMDLSQEEFLKKIQEALLSCEKEGNDCSACLEEAEQLNESKPEEAKEVEAEATSVKPAVPHENVLDVLSPEDLNFILTQLKMTRLLGRASVGSLKHLLQQMKMYKFAASCHVAPIISPEITFSYPMRIWCCPFSFEEMSTSTNGLTWAASV